MTYTFTVDGREAYRLTKTDPGWELTFYDEGGRIIEKGRWQGQATKAGWKKMNQGNGCYPSNIRHALDLMMDDLILRSVPDQKMPIIDGLKEVRTLLTKIDCVLDAKAVDFMAL